MLPHARGGFFLPIQAGYREWHNRRALLLTPRQRRQLRYEPQVMRGRDDRDMSHVKREARQPALHIVATLIESHQCLHGEGVEKIMDTWPPSFGVADASLLEQLSDSRAQTASAVGAPTPPTVAKQRCAGARVGAGVPLNPIPKYRRRRDCPMLDNISFRRKITDLVMRYNWETPEDGKRMLGWLACALVGASLRHRPHVWLSGYPGKSWFMNHLQHALHQHHYRYCASPEDYRTREGRLPLHVIDAADYRDTNNEIIRPARRRVQKVINACRAASGRFDMCGDFGPLCFSACVMSWEQPEMTRYETRQFAPVRLGETMSREGFLRYESEAKELLGNNELLVELQNSISEAAAEIAEQADKLDQTAAHESDRFRQVEICAIRGALSAGWQWWSGTDELLGYWAGERPITGQPE